MEPTTPQDAQRLVAAYLSLVETHAAADVYPCAVGELPASKDTLRAAFRTCVRALAGGDQLTPQLREYLELAYVSLADYVDEECVTLLREYGQAGAALAEDRRLAREKVGSEAWRRLSEQGRLAGQLARTMGEEAERLRNEFRSWPAGATVSER